MYRDAYPDSERRLLSASDRRNSGVEPTAARLERVSEVGGQQSTEIDLLPDQRADGRRLRILVVEDSAGDAELLLDQFGETGLWVGVQVVPSLRRAEQALQAADWDLVMLDLHLPESRGLATLDQMRRLVSDRVPLVILSGDDTESLQDEAIRRGAQDFLVKGAITAYGVGRVVRHAFERDRYERALRDAHRRMRASERLEAVGQLAGGIAHDFNNMLSVVLTSVDLAQRGEGGDLVSLLGGIRQAAERSQHLTRQLLAFASRQVLESTTLDLRRVVEGMRPLLETTIGDGIELGFDLSQEATWVEADVSQMEQVLMNLVINARDALQGQGRIDIRVGARAGNELPEDLRARGGVPYVVLTVRDNGPGIDPELADRVFEPFVTSKPEGEGTGLGLATVYGIARQSGGEVEMRSRPGKGTAVSFYLPRRDQPAPDAESAVTSSSPAAGPQGLSGKSARRVLLVEDEMVLRKLVARILRGLGYEVVEAVDSHQALQLCCDPAFELDLLLSDVVMPGMDGRTLLEEVRRLRPELPALLVSGYSADLVSEGVGSGFDFLPKPLTRDSLAERLEEIFARQVDS